MIGRYGDPYYEHLRAQLRTAFWHGQAVGAIGATALWLIVWALIMP